MLNCRPHWFTCILAQTCNQVHTSAVSWSAQLGSASHCWGGLSGTPTLGRLLSVAIKRQKDYSDIVIPQLLSRCSNRSKLFLSWYLRLYWKKQPLFIQLHRLLLKQRDYNSSFFHYHHHHRSSVYRLHNSALMNRSNWPSKLVLPLKQCVSALFSSSFCPVYSLKSCK